MASTDDLHDPAFEVPADYVAELFRLGGRVAVVTGGGSGLGAAMAKGLADVVPARKRHGMLTASLARPGVSRRGGRAERDEVVSVSCEYLVAAFCL